MTAGDIFYWIGVTVSILAGLAGVAVSLLLIYGLFISGRFGLIFFRKSPRQLSIASWHETKLLKKWDRADDMDDWPADDYPIGPRPFYLSYRFRGQKHLFVMVGYHTGHRHIPIRGLHPPC